MNAFRTEACCDLLRKSWAVELQENSAINLRVIKSENKKHYVNEHIDLFIFVYCYVLGYLIFISPTPSLIIWFEENQTNRRQFFYTIFSVCIFFFVCLLDSFLRLLHWNCLVFVSDFLSAFTRRLSQRIAWETLWDFETKWGENLEVLTGIWRF